MKKTLLVFTLIATIVMGNVAYAASQGVTPNGQSTDDVHILPVETNKLTFDFIKGLDGFKVLFADLPADADREELFELDYGHAKIPVAGNDHYGIYVKGSNRSDDLFSYIYRKIGVENGLKPHTTYEMNIHFTMATNEPEGGFGAGGAPGESVFVKAGVVGEEPLPYVDGSNYLRMALDKGNQAFGGKDMKLVGNISKVDGSFDHSYAYKEYETTVVVTTDAQGNAYIVIGTDSGYEGKTMVFYDNVEVTFNEVR